MYSKKLYLKEEKVVKPPTINKWAVKQSIVDNTPISEKTVDQLIELYSITEYNDATEYLFGDPNILVTKLTIFQAKRLVSHAKLVNKVIKKKIEKDVLLNSNIEPYRNIWSTLEKRAR